MERISVLKAASILGCGRRRARTLLAQHGFIGGSHIHSIATLEDVEAIARGGYRWKRHTSDTHSYWVTSGQAAEILGLSIPRLKQLATAGRLPFVTHDDGTRMFRREQISTIANAKEGATLGLCLDRGVARSRGTAVEEPALSVLLSLDPDQVGWELAALRLFAGVHPAEVVAFGDDVDNRAAVAVGVDLASCSHVVDEPVGHRKDDPLPK